MMTTEAYPAWRRYIATYEKDQAAALTLAEHQTFPVALVRSSLANWRERSAALVYVQQLPTDAKQALFPEILAIASIATGRIVLARTIILSLPLAWLLTNIEAYAEELLTAERPDPYEEYRRLLELYYLIDASLTRRLATRAAQSDDVDIREAGEDFLELLDR